MPATTSTTSIRTATVARLLELLRAHPELAGVDCDPGPPGKAVKRRHVYVGKIDGARKPPFSMGDARLVRDDAFTVKVVFQAGELGRSMVAAMAEAEAMSTALQDVLADDFTLGELPGLDSAVEGAVEGPDGWNTDQGAIAFVVVDVVCQARYL